jgi:hypothetical protein
LYSNVVRFTPSRRAAPLGPPMTPSVSCKVLKMCLRSASARERSLVTGASL